MTLGSRLAGRLARLPPPRVSSVAVERDLPMVADDGVVLLADRWYPVSRDERPPVILLRSPYGRRQLGFVGRLFAERGYQAVIQSCRGTFGSGGEWVPFRHEQADGRRALHWLAEQPWWGGAAGTFGPSYLGLTQWAVAADPPAELRAMALDVTCSHFRDTVVYPGGSFTLETGATWLYLLEHQERGLARVLAAQLLARRRLSPAFTTLPLAEAEAAALGRTVDFYQDWLRHERFGDPWWDAVDFSRELTQTPPATMLAGWYDIFLPAQVDDFDALVAAGRPARLTIGPWTHSSPRAAAAGLRDGIEWFDAELRRAGRLRRDPVRFWLLGARRWVDVPGWPPRAVTTRWHLQPGGGLDPAAPPTSEPDRYRWDPADPTPGDGGPSLNAARAGPRDQRRREHRADVICFTSGPLPEELTLAGAVTADIWLRSSNWHTDVFTRLCRVDGRGRSTNLSDGILRLAPGEDGASLVQLGSPVQGSVERHPDGVARVRIRMWPTAATFPRGHRLRLQVSGGAHPLFARNPGGGEPLGSATVLVPADHEVFHDPTHPSAIELPHADW